MKISRFTFGFKAPFLEDFKKTASIGRSPDLLMYETPSHPYLTVAK